MLYQTKIIGTGHYVPENIVTNHDIAQRVETSDEWIRERTGIRERRLAQPDREFPSFMATQAAKMAIAKAGIEPNQIDLILFSITIPDYVFPNTASVLQEQLGITNHCACLDINAACTGYLYGLNLADSLIQTGKYHTILLIGCEMTSRFNNWDDRNSCILFGDGCGATLLSRAAPQESSQIYRAILASDSSKKDALIMKCGGSRRPIDAAVLEEKAQYVTMDGQQVYKAAVKTLAQLSHQVVTQSGYTVGDIDWFVPHQANLRIIEAAAQRLEFPMEKTVLNVDRYANTSSASIPIALDEAITDGRIQRGQRLLFASFGAGLTSGALFLQY